MNTKRIEEIQKETAYPDSISVQQALLKVWNECEQEEAVKNNAVLPLVSERTLGINSCAALIKSMPTDQAIQIMKSDITGQPQTTVIDGELVVAYVR